MLGQSLGEFPDTPDIHGVNRDVRHIAGIHRRGQFGHMVFTDSKASGKQDQSLPSGQGTQIPGHDFQGQKSVAGGEIRPGSTGSRTNSTLVVSGKAAATLAKVVRIETRGSRALRSDGRNRGLFGFPQSFRQELRIRGQALTELESAAVIGHGHHAIGAEVRRDELGGSLAGPRLVGQAHAGVIEEEHDVLFHRARGRFAFEGKALHHLFRFVFPNAKILGGEIANVVSFFIRDDGIHQHQLGFSSNNVSGSRGHSGFGRLSRQHETGQAERGYERNYRAKMHGLSS